MLAPEITSEMLLTILSALREIVKMDDKMDAAIVRFNFVPNPDMSKCGYIDINFLYKMI